VKFTFIDLADPLVAGSNNDVMICSDLCRGKVKPTSAQYESATTEANVSAMLPMCQTRASKQADRTDFDR
jgi:hypothetical protein